MLSLALFVACDPYAGWPEATDVFPYVFTPDDLEPYEEVRVETETWVPLADPEETLLYLQKAVDHRPGAPIEEVLHFGQSRPHDGLQPGDPRLSFVGDVMWIGEGWSDFAAPVAQMLDGGLRVGNLETPVAPGFPTDRGSLGLYAFNAPLSFLDEMPLDVVQINNNHALDLGDIGLELTHKSLVGRGFTPVGMDDNTVLVDFGNDVLVAVVTYTWGVNVIDPSAHDLAVIPFGHVGEPIPLGRVRRDIAAARVAGASHVVLTLHWGFEYEYYPDPHFMQLARRMVEHGADVIVGHGPHVVQPAEICAVNQPVAVPGIGQCSVRTEDDVPRDAAVLYSLGNFGTELSTLPLQVGLIAHVSLEPTGGVSGMAYQAVASVDGAEGKSVVPLEDLLSDPQYADEAARLDQHLGTSWKRAR